MKSFTLSEFVRKPAEVTHQAARAPVALTAHRKPRFVLLAMEDYERLVRAGDTRQAFRIEEAPEEHLRALMEGAETILQLGREGETSRGASPPSGAKATPADDAE